MSSGTAYLCSLMQGQSKVFNLPSGILVRCESSGETKVGLTSSGSQSLSEAELGSFSASCRIDNAKLLVKLCSC